MADPRLIVESLCAALAETQPLENLPLAELATAYAELCAQTNARLRRCLDCLRQGLYSEAVQLAETPPNVLDLVAALDFPRRDQWDALCGRSRLPAAPPLRLQAAQEINESYPKEAELRPLLAQQRRLALARAPLRQRLMLLRDVEQKDPNSASWKEDINALESARLIEIRAQAARLSPGHDGAAAALLEELDNPNWRSPVPADLRQHLETQALAHRNAQALATLAALIAPMEKAQAENDFDGAVALRERWLAALEPVRRSVEPPLLGRGQAVLDWILLTAQQRQTQKEFEEACAALRLALKMKAAPAELARLHQAVKAAHLDVPAGLAAEYAAALQAHQRHARHQRLRNLAIAVALSLGVLALGVVFVSYEMRRQDEQNWRDKLNAAIETSHWDEGESLWKQMMAQAPRLGSDEEFRKLRIKIDDSLKAQRDRDQEFQTHMQAARSAGVEEPLLAELGAADQAAQTDAQKTEVANFRAAVAAAAHKRRAAAQADFETRLAALKTDAGALDEKRLSDDPAAFARRLVADEQEEQALRAMAAAGEAGDKGQQLPRLQNQLAQARQKLSVTSAEQTQLDQVHEASYSGVTLAPALKEFTTRYPDAPQAREFNAALAYAPAWDAMQAWNGIMAGWGGKLGVDSANQASQHAQQIAEFIRRYPVSPLAIDQQNYLQYLTQAQGAGDAPWKKSVVQLMQSPLIADIDVLPTVRGVYYLRSDAKITRTSLGASFPAILSNDVTHTTTQTLKEAELSAKEPMPSPQSLLAKAILQDLDKPPAGDWETAPLVVAQRVREQKELDPILQVVLLGQILRSAESGTWGLDSVLREPLARLAELHAEDIVWVNPIDAGAQAARPAATAAVAALPAFADLQAQVIAQRQRIFDALRWNLAGQGGLFRTSGGWMIQTRVPLQNGLEAFIVGGADPGHPDTLRIAKVKDGKWELDEQKLAVAVEGSLVFICRAP
jgi:hypothetical protein